MIDSCVARGQSVRDRNARRIERAIALADLLGKRKELDAGETYAEEPRGYDS